MKLNDLSTVVFRAKMCIHWRRVALYMLLFMDALANYFLFSDQYQKVFDLMYPYQTIQYQPPPPPPTTTSALGSEKAEDVQHVVLFWTRFSHTISLKKWFALTALLLFSKLLEMDEVGALFYML